MHKRYLIFIGFILTLFSLAPSSLVAQKHSATSAHISYDGISMTGYQGWFGTPGDGGTNNWRHYSKGGVFQPGTASIEYWPDMRETDPDERYETSFTFDGGPATVFTSVNPKTVNRHFQWMKEYGVDGAFVQRFRSDFGLRPTLNKVMANALQGAENNGRAVALMYDIGANIYETGTDSASVNTRRTYYVNQIFDDWKFLVDSIQLTTKGNDQAYLYHNGKPMVALWGVGFNHRHSSTGVDMRFWEELVDKFQNDPDYGGCSILLGVPTRWRQGGNDCISGAEHTRLINLINNIDAIMPWHTSRFSRSQMATNFKSIVLADNNWCLNAGITYAPNISPGIREKILHGNGYEKHREGGYYYWDMAKAALEAGSKSFYLGMFDEIDEGTQIHKINNNPPFYSNSLSFTSYGDDPEDHYLWLAGEITRALKGEFTMGATFRNRANDSDFQADISFVDNDSTYEMNLSAPVSGRKIYFADPYKVPDGAPTIGTIRDSSLFGNELTTTAVTFGVEQRGMYVRFVEVDATTDEIISFNALVGTYGHTSIPYATSFESGIVESRFWATKTENATGVVQVSEDFTPKTGKYHLTMGDSSNGTAGNNTADLHITLEGITTGLKLDFSYKTYASQVDPDDGIYFSDDRGNTFAKVFDFSSTSGDYEDTSLNVNYLTESLGLSFNDKFVIRFQHKSYQAIPNGGIAIDDVRILYSGEKSGYAQYLDKDDTTQGAWMGTFGEDGHFIVEKEDNLPGYANIIWETTQSVVWEDNSTDVRGLQYTSNSTILSAYQSDTVNTQWWFTLDVGNQESDVSIYFLDGDNQNRIFDLTVMDHFTGDKYDKRTIKDFENGKWITWKVRGKVRFVADVKGGPDAVISGVFFSPGTPANIDVELDEYLTFDGVDDIVDCGKLSSLQISGNAMTVEAWFKMNRTKQNTYQSTILAMDHSEPGNDFGYFLRANGNGQVNWGFGDGTWHEIESEEGIQYFELGAWNHVAGIYDGQFQKIFINGNLVAQTDSFTASIMPAPTESLYIGSTPAFANRVIDAGLSEVRIWNIARTDSEIKEFASKRITGAEAGLAAYWAIDEGQGQKINDLSSNMNDGILGGTPAENKFDPLWVGGSVSIEDFDLNDENISTLSQNYPNPFYGTTTINYTLSQSSKIELSIYNISGQYVAKLVDRNMNPGAHQVVWDARDLPGGIYLAILKTGSTYSTKKMTLIKE